MNPEDLQTLSKPKLARRLRELNNIQEDVMAEMVMIREEILARLDEEKKDGEIIEEYAFRKMKRITFKTTLEEAQELGAVKLTPDTKALRKIHNKGAVVPGTKITVYLSVKRLEQEHE